MCHWVFLLTQLTLIESTHDKGPSFENGSPVSTLPESFAEVMGGIYRSSFPQENNFRALKNLDLKTIVYVYLCLLRVACAYGISRTLVDEPYSLAHQTFLKDGGITHHRILVQANKDPSVKTSSSVIAKILEVLLTKSNQPVLVHCNKGKVSFNISSPVNSLHNNGTLQQHRTGCIIACLRKFQGWSLESVIHEYVRYSHPKTRELDKKFIEEFDVSSLVHLRPSPKASLWDAPRTPVVAVESDDDDGGYPSPTWYLQSPINKVNIV